MRRSPVADAFLAFPAALDELVAFALAETRPEVRIGRADTILYILAQLAQRRVGRPRLQTTASAEEEPSDE